MKKILVLVLIIAFSYLQAQDAHVLEFRINIKNNSSSKTILAKLENVNWAESWDANTSNFDEHDLKAFSPPNRTSNSNNTIGWNICWQPTGVTYTFGLANYKCSIYKDGTLSDYFYIDYRTSDLAEAYQSWNDDIDVYFNVINGKLYWDYSLTQLVGTGSEETIWDLSPNITQITTELEPYTVASFSVSGSTYPQLSWSHWPEGYRTDYAVYRSVVSGCGSQAAAFTKIASLSANATSYTDYDFSVGGPITAYYIIRAVNGTRESEDSDIEKICVGFNKDNKSYKSFDYSLDQNFPNPFNPHTKITYSIKETGFVSLKVYDNLGREISTLVSETMAAGTYEVNFDASTFPSGVYIYKIQAGNFAETKKLILMK